MKSVIRTLGLCLLLVALAAPAQALRPIPPSRVNQISTLEALLAGVYDGETTFAQLADLGDLGLGTFNRLDGEMIALDGKFYQVRADGKVYQVRPQQKTPFANMVFFRVDRRLALPRPVGLAAFKKWLDGQLPSPNLFYALRITGRFSRVKVRSVPAQKKPYPPLVAVVKHQSVWEYRDIEGTLVGFRFPPYVKGINVTGYHLHFIDKQRTRGGHLLDADLGQATVEVDYLHGLLLELPTSGDFLKRRLGKDTSKAVRAVER